MPKKRFAGDINNWRIRHTLKSFGVSDFAFTLVWRICPALPNRIYRFPF